MKKDDERREIFQTIAIIAILFAIVIFALIHFNMLNDYESKLRSRAEFICWHNDYFGGMDNFYKRSDGFYFFSCKNVSFKYRFNNGSGILIGGVD